MKLFRQGDILIREVKSLPKNLKKQSGLMVAEGEATGHHHQFSGSGVSIWLLNDDKYLDVSMPSPLIHPEHQKIIIEPGKYEIIKEREYDYIEEQRKTVVD